MGSISILQATAKVFSCDNSKISLKSKEEPNAMEPIRLEPQLPVEPLDEATKAAIAEGLASAQRGELVTLEQSNINLKKRVQAWHKAKEETAVPA